MKLHKNSRAYLMATMASLSVCMVQAKDIKGLVLANPSVPANTSASLQISFTTNDSALCGVTVDWGNGTKQNIRLGRDPYTSSPATLNYAYPNPGTYNIKLEGLFLSRGLYSAVACNVLAKQVTVKVTDPAAEKLAAETQAAQIAAETALKQAAARAQEAALREQEAAQRERAALAAAEKSKQDLLLQQAAAREMELNLKAKELERREAQMRKDEEARRAAPTARPAAAAAPAPAPAPAAPAGTRPRVKSADGF